jgi:hypothetical protein
MTFEGEVSWMVTAKIRVQADNKAEAIAKIVKNHTGYTVISEHPDSPEKIYETDIKIKLKQVK